MTARILAVVPAHNEEAALPGVIEDLRSHAPDVDVVVIDDGSSDSTFATASELGVAVVRLPLNVGIGGAVQAGFRLAYDRQYDVAIQFDGDGQHTASEIQALVAPVLDGSADVVIGSRFLSPAGFRSTAARRVGIRLFRLLGRLTTRAAFTDWTSGFRAYNRAAIQLLADTYPSDYPEVEAVVLLQRWGLRILEVPVIMRERQGGHSSITGGHAFYYMSKVLLASIVSRFKPRRPGSRPPP